MVDLEYVEVDGLLYPNIDTGSDELSQLNKYGKMRLEYIHAQKPALYRELLFTGKLTEHCLRIEAEAFKLSERVRMQYLAKHPAPPEGMERIQVFTQAQFVADEVVQFQVIEI